jgi:hypothetical protein
MQGRFNMQYLKQVQQHIPGPTDTPKLMYEKTNWLLKNLPTIRQSIVEGETTRNVGGQLKTGNQPTTTNNPYGR